MPLKCQMPAPFQMHDHMEGYERGNLADGATMTVEGTEEGVRPNVTATVASPGDHRHIPCRRFDLRWHKRGD